MTSELTEEEIKAAEEIEKQVKADFQILNAVNKTDPKEVDKKAYYQLIKEKPHMLNSMTSLIESNQEYILSENCSFLMAEKLKRQIKKMRDDLGYENSSELERLLIEQVCVNWLRVNLLEKAHAVKTSQSHTLDAGIYWDKRLTSAQRRYLRACETLAKVRKLTAEAELREQQAQNKRSKGAAISHKLLKDLTK